MSEYIGLEPRYATSQMRITANSRDYKLNFNNLITYYYEDFQNDPDWASYRDYLKSEENYQREISTYWENLQMFLDEETNIVNGEEVKLRIIHTNIIFPRKETPLVQWTVEFDGPLNEGINTYENMIEEEVLEYPVYSLYIFEKPMKVKTVESTLEYILDPNKRIIEYYGSVRDVLGEYEKIQFTLN